MFVIFVLSRGIIGNVRQPKFDVVSDECKSHGWQDLVLVCMPISCARIMLIQITQHRKRTRSCVCCLTVAMLYFCFSDIFMLDFNDDERETDLVLVVIFCRLDAPF